MATLEERIENLEAKLLRDGLTDQAAAVAAHKHKPFLSANAAQEILGKNWRWADAYARKHRERKPGHKKATNQIPWQLVLETFEKEKYDLSFAPLPTKLEEETISFPEQVNNPILEERYPIKQERIIMPSYEEASAMVTSDNDKARWEKLKKDFPTEVKFMAPYYKRIDACLDDYDHDGAEVIKAELDDHLHDYRTLRKLYELGP